MTLSVIQNGAPISVQGVYPFGNVPLGSVATAVFQLTNTGTSPVYLTGLALSGPLSSTAPYAPYFSVLCAQSPDLCGKLPILINPTGTLDFTVEFEPFQLGTPSAILTVNAGNTFSAILSGKGVPGFSILWNGQPLGAGETIAFGQVQVGSSQTESIFFTNPGAVSLSVPAIPALTGGVFSLSGTALGAPSVAPGASAELDITFTPVATGIQQSILMVGLFTYPLEGTGIASMQATLPVPSIQLTPATLASAQQGNLLVNLESAAAAAGTGTVTLAFQSAITGVDDDPAITFSDGSRSAAFTVAPGASTGQFSAGPSLPFATGTTAGTITFTATLGSNTAQASITIAPSLIGVDAAVASRNVACDPAIIYCTAVNVELQVNGWDNTRSVSQLTFTFYDQGGSEISPGNIPVSAASAFESYFGGSNLGGVFGLTAFFPVTGDSESSGRGGGRAHQLSRRDAKFPDHVLKLTLS